MSLLFFHDLNNDGKSEKIDTYYEAGKRTAIQIFSADGVILDQWNLSGQFTEPRNQSVFIGDAGGDSSMEIFVFTIKKDSVFISCIDKLDGSFRFKEKFLSIISDRYFDEPNYSLIPEGLFNLFDENSSVLIISISGARSLQPRKLVAFDYVKDSLYCSGTYGIIPTSIKEVDLNRDGKKELTGYTSASGNIPDSLGIPFHDYSAWFMVFNSSLELFFEPKEFPGFRNEITVLPIKHNDIQYLAALLNPVGIGKDHPVGMLFDAGGNILKEYPIQHLGTSSKIFSLNPFDNSEVPSFLLVDQKGSLEELDIEFNSVRRSLIKTTVSPGILITDLDLNGKYELVLTSESGKTIFIYESISSKPTEYVIPPDFGIANISTEIIGNKTAVLLLQGVDYYQVLEYHKNPLYYFKWIVYLGIYAGLLLFIMLIRKLQRIQIEKNQAVKEQILQLQLKTIHNQMDPHFTFNVFNSIAHIIRNEDREFAFQSFIKFTGIIRSTLMDSDKIVRKLEDELKFAENYLGLEKLRYKNRLEHEITISPDVNLSTMVPKMILQIYVENAVKHGIRHLPEGGKVTVTLQADDKKLLMTVEDNGIGRKKAAELSKESTGMGLKIMESYIGLYNQLSKQKLSYKIIDLYNSDGNAAGTRVEICLPL